MIIILYKPQRKMIKLKEELNTRLAPKDVFNTSLIN